MTVAEHITRADVTYRATAADGREVEVRLLADPSLATAADAWKRLTAVYTEVDPTSLEIEIREVAGYCTRSASQR